VKFMSNQASSQQVLPLNVEQKLRQIILKDLVSDKVGLFYKQHTEAMLAQARAVIQENELKNPVATQLLLAVYGYHWGCCHLHEQPGHAHKNLMAHKDVCFKLSAIKLERFLIYHFPKLLTQGQLLEMVDAVEAQNQQKLPTKSLASLLKTVVISVTI